MDGGGGAVTGGGGEISGGGSGGGGRNRVFSRRSWSGYLRVVSSGAANVASSVRAAGASVAASIAELDDTGRSQVNWAGFDKLELQRGVFRRVLLLGYRSGFQVWDVEEGDDVRQLVARHDCAVSFLQIQKTPIASQISEDNFAYARPLLVLALEQTRFVGSNTIRGVCSPSDGSDGNSQEAGVESLLPTSVGFYSLRSHEYVHTLRFRSPVYSIRCSPRVVAISLSAQIHCFNAATLAIEYTVSTCPILPISCSCGIGCGPLALGSRWLAYSGTPVECSSTDRVTPQSLDPATGLSPCPTRGSLVAHYARESSKQLAAGLVTLGDMGYKKLSKYCSELVPDNNASLNHGIPSLKDSSTINGNLSDKENLGVVIVRDIVSKSVVVQFRAHESPIASLTFDPSETLLVTASIRGHNINVFHIIPSLTSSASGASTGTCVHLYKLQRGITNAVIQDFSFSDDSQWIMVSSSRGTSHLFSMSHDQADLIAALAVQGPHTSGRSKVNHQSLLPQGSPITVSTVSKIKSGSHGWKGAVSGAAAAATGKATHLSGAIASSFHNCKGSSRSNRFPDTSSLWTKNYLLVFSPSGCIIQYVLRHSTSEDPGIGLSALGALSNGSLHESDPRLVVEPLQKWDVCHKRNRRDQGDNNDVYGKLEKAATPKAFQKGTKKATSVYPGDGPAMKVKPTAEEINHMYISEAELQTHSDHSLWTKSKVHFQVMVDENILNDSSSAIDVEVEIERIPTRTLEARTKELVPVVDYLQTPRLEKSRLTSSGSNRIGPVISQKSGVLEDGTQLCRSSCCSLDSVPQSDSAAEHRNDLSENFVSDIRPSVEANEGIVNTNVYTPDIETQLKIVNNTESLKVEARLEHVNNEEDLKMETASEGCDNRTN